MTIKKLDLHKVDERIRNEEEVTDRDRWIEREVKVFKFLIPKVPSYYLVRKVVC
jgi:hypothetical protein